MKKPPKKERMSARQLRDTRAVLERYAGELKVAHDRLEKAGDEIARLNALARDKQREINRLEEIVSRVADAIIPSRSACY